MGQQILKPVDKYLLEKELTKDKFVRSFKGLEVYVVTAHNSPHLMDEIGRIREFEFRKEGGGTGKEKDIDQYDVGEDAVFKQLIAWDTTNREIVGMYRFVRCTDALREDGSYFLPTARLFNFSEKFKKEYLPKTIELGRSVVNRKAKKRMLGLFVTWAGLGALVNECPGIEYFFGKFTMYKIYNTHARDILHYFLTLYFNDEENLVTPLPEYKVEISVEEEKLRGLFTGNNYTQDFQNLINNVKKYGESLPPLIISYTGLSNKMKYFGTSENRFFGNVEESAIMVAIKDIYEKQKKKFVSGYESINPDVFS